jgi:hypothetical protein
VHEIAQTADRVVRHDAAAVNHHDMLADLFYQFEDVGNMARPGNLWVTDGAQG